MLKEQRSKRQSQKGKYLAPTIGDFRNDFMIVQDLYRSYVGYVPGVIVVETSVALTASVSIDF